MCPVKILVCDDEHSTVRLVQVHFERLGIKVATASDGREALAKIRELRPSLVFLDVVMPHIDGFEILKEIRKDPTLQHVTVVVLSAMAQDEDVSEGLRCGADYYMTKPFNPEDLDAVAKQIA